MRFFTRQVLQEFSTKSHVDSSTSYSRGKCVGKRSALQLHLRGNISKLEVEG